MTQLVSAGVVTVIGLSALLEAQLADEPFSANNVQLSSDIMACSGQETALTNVVYNALPAQVTQSQIDVNTIRTTLSLDTTVGNFSIGTMGLLTSSGVLFALGTFPGAGMKLASNLPTLLGNVRTFYFDVGFVNITAALTPITGSLIALSTPTALQYATGAVSARQLRTALANVGQLEQVNSVIASSDPQSQAVIDWDTCRAVFFNSPVLNLCASATGASDEGAALLAAAMLIST